MSARRPLWAVDPHAAIAQARKVDATLDRYAAGCGQIVGCLITLAIAAGLAGGVVYLLDVAVAGGGSR